MQQQIRIKLNKKFLCKEENTFVTAFRHGRPIFPCVKNRAWTFFNMPSELVGSFHVKIYSPRSSFAIVDLHFNRLLPFILLNLNLFGSLVDLYCLSITFTLERLVPSRFGLVFEECSIIYWTKLNYQKDFSACFCHL